MRYVIVLFTILISMIVGMVLGYERSQENSLVLYIIGGLYFFIAQFVANRLISIELNKTLKLYDIDVNDNELHIAEMIDKNTKMFLNHLPEVSKDYILKFAKDENLDYFLAREVIVSDIVSERQEMDFSFLLKTAKEHQNSRYISSSPRSFLLEDEKTLFGEYCKHHEL